MKKILIAALLGGLSACASAAAPSITTFDLDTIGTSFAEARIANHGPEIMRLASSSGHAIRGAAEILAGATISVRLLNGAYVITQ